jgi:hypothetical protein
MDPDEEEIAQFVANKTGLPLDRAARILKLGEPWPFVKAFGELFSHSFRDADGSNVALETALNANAELAEMGVQSLSAESVTQHLEQTAGLTGEEEETVRAVQLALHEFFRLMLERVKQVLKKTAS